MFHSTLLSTLQVNWMQEYLVYLSLYHPKAVSDKYLDEFDQLSPQLKRYLNYNHHAPFVHGSMNNDNWPKLYLGTNRSVKHFELDVLNKTQWIQVFDDVKSHKLEIKFKYNENLPFVYLTGYGVELVVKSTDYLVTDDRAIENTFTLEHNEDPSLDIPESMVKVSNDDISVKAWSYISNLKKSDSEKFSDLVLLSQNFLLYKEYISTQNINIKLDSAIKYNTLRSDMHGIFVNGLNIHDDLINSISLDSLINDEQIISSFVKDPSLLFSFDLKVKPTFKIPVPTWLNKIEKNPAFKSYPATLSEAFQMWQFYKQMMPVMPVQKHVINVVLISNLLDIQHVSSILNADIAIHIGIIPLPYTSDKPGLSYTLHYVAKSNYKNVRKFLKVYSELDGIYSENVLNACKKVISCDSLVEDYKSDLPKLDDFAKSFNLKDSSLYWLNGQIHEITSEFEQSVIQKARAEYDELFKHLEDGRITEDTNIFNFYNKGFTTRHAILDQLRSLEVLNLQAGDAIKQEIEYLKEFADFHIILIKCQFSLKHCKTTIESVGNNVIVINSDDNTCNLMDLTRIPLVLNSMKYKNSIFINGKCIELREHTDWDIIRDVAAQDEVSDDILSVFGLKYAKASIEKRNSPYHPPMMRKVMSTKLKRPLKAHSADCKINITAAFDPFTLNGQKWISVLSGFKHTCITLYPIIETGEINRFYRYSHPSLTSSIKTLTFANLPPNVLLTSGIDSHPSWVVAAKRAVHDLDNLIINGEDVYAEYELKHLLIEGHCFDDKRRPPSGLQIELSNYDDTIVMSNLGYFQLKANPGIWQFQLRKGKSSDVYSIYEMEDSVGRHIASKNGVFRIIVDDLQGKVLFPKVRKNKGQEDISLINEDYTQDQMVWSFLNRKEKIINIFTLASGHLYERFMSIMIKSVLMHTSSKVKLWLVEDFLSPTYKIFISSYAEKYGFEYEFITYKWPSWLRSQREKQRLIWGYKILFLDVLFPLDLERIIFVDSDQIIRADLQELMDLDLKGNPYAYTPFCRDIREETKNFRFWESGYWKNHLGDKPYHISALYVVDLKRFRQMAAGDLLRGQYQSLTIDPNSLANLDQDLPNNMQDRVPIYSLPDEWLYCETWCSDEAFKKAKTIDLCNNPLTKEPKLHRAKRQIKEWVEYDEEISKFSKSLLEKSVEQDEKDEL